MAVLNYEGYWLYQFGPTYESKINGEIRHFDTAGQFIQYINFIKGK